MKILDSAVQVDPYMDYEIVAKRICLKCEHGYPLEYMSRKSAGCRNCGNTESPTLSSHIFKRDIILKIE